MATKVQKVKVGVFILVAVSLTLAVFLVSVGFYGKTGTEYHITFDESVLGLTEGGLVEYLGVPVGRVSNIKVTSANSAHVTVSIDPEKVVLREGVKAQLVIHSLAAGTMAVSLAGGDPDGDRLPPGSTIPTHPSTFTAMTGQLEQFMENLRGVVDSIEKGLAGMEEGELADIIKEVRETADDIHEFVNKSTELLANVNETVDTVRDEAKTVVDKAVGVSDDVQKIAKEVRKLVTTMNGKVESFDVAKTQENLNRVLENMGNLSEKLDKAVGQFDDISANVMHEADNIEYSLRTTLKDLSQTLDSTRTLVEDLQRNPSAVVRGRATTRGESE